MAYTWSDASQTGCNTVDKLQTTTLRCVFNTLEVKLPQVTILVTSERDISSAHGSVETLSPPSNCGETNQIGGPARPICHHSMSQIWSWINTLFCISLADTEVHSKWDFSGIWRGNESGSVKWWTPARNNNESDYKAVWSPPCARNYATICTRCRGAYGLGCHPHLDNRRDMHYSDGGKTQLFSLQDDGVQGTKCVERGGGDALITHHDDESSVCHGRRYK